MAFQLKAATPPNTNHKTVRRANQSYVEESATVQFAWRRSSKKQHEQKEFAPAPSAKLIPPTKRDVSAVARIRAFGRTNGPQLVRLAACMDRNV